MTSGLLFNIIDKMFYLTTLFVLFGFPLFFKLLSPLFPLERKESEWKLLLFPTIFCVVIVWAAYIPQFFANPILPTSYTWTRLLFYYFLTYFGFPFWATLITILIIFYKQKREWNLEQCRKFLITGFAILFISLLWQYGFLQQHWYGGIELILAPLWYQILFLLFLIELHHEPLRWTGFLGISLLVSLFEALLFTLYFSLPWLVWAVTIFVFLGLVVLLVSRKEGKTNPTRKREMLTANQFRRVLKPKAKR